jgi:hypothetical protein
MVWGRSAGFRVAWRTGERGLVKVGLSAWDADYAR